MEGAWRLWRGGILPNDPIRGSPRKSFRIWIYCTPPSPPRNPNPANVRAEKLSAKIQNRNGEKKERKIRKYQEEGASGAGGWQASRLAGYKISEDGTAKCFWPIGHTRPGHQVRIMSGI